MELLPLTSTQRVIGILVLNLIYCCILLYIRYNESHRVSIENIPLLTRIDKAEQYLNNKFDAVNHQRSIHESEVKVEPPDVLELEVSINASGVALHVNRNMVYSDINRTMLWGKRQARLYGGVHVVLLHQNTGAVMRAESFMTWQPSNHRHLVNMIHTINAGRLCLLIGVAEFTTHLSEEAVGAIQALGSSFIDKVTTKDLWFMVIRKGGRNFHEAIVTSKPVKLNNFTDVSPVTAHVIVPKTSEGTLCKWHGTVGMEQHAAFCNSYGAYGSFCRCQQPFMPKPGVSYPMHEKIPIAIATAKRLTNVLRMVNEIWKSPGGGETPIAIFVDGFNREAQELGNILNIPVIFHQHNGPRVGSPVNQHIAFTLEHVFLQFPDVDKAIILEDDLKLAPDFVPYFQQTAGLLDGDPNLLCVNAFNYNSMPHTSYDPKRLYRVHSVPAYGWMIRRTWAKRMLESWPNATHVGADWDLYLRNSNTGLLGNWDIIIPEVPRTKHNRGGAGVHSTGLEQERFFNHITLNTDVNVTLDINGSAISDPEKYFYHHMNIIANAKVIKITQHPCKVNPLPMYKTNESYVIYMNQTTEGGDCPSYFILATCLGINERDAHESLQLMFTFPFYGNQVYLIACPNSPFCSTNDISVIYNGSKDDLAYAGQHPLRNDGYHVSYYERIPPENVEEEINLSNMQEISFQ